MCVSSVLCACRLPDVDWIDLTAKALFIYVVHHLAARGQNGVVILNLSHISSWRNYEFMNYEKVSENSYLRECMKKRPKNYVV